MDTNKINTRYITSRGEYKNYICIYMRHISNCIRRLFWGLSPHQCSTERQLQFFVHTFTFNRLRYIILFSRARLENGLQKYVNSIFQISNLFVCKPSKVVQLIPSKLAVAYGCKFLLKVIKKYTGSLSFSQKTSFSSCLFFRRDE